MPKFATQLAGGFHAGILTPHLTTKVGSAALTASPSLDISWPYRKKNIYFLQEGIDLGVFPGQRFNAVAMTEVIQL